MSTKTPRGRPSRRRTELAGRDKLIQSARAIMREKVPVRLHRKNIAEAAGLAPALVTYYFQDESSLIEAAARPIVEDYLSRLKATLSGTGDPRHQLTQLVLLLLEIGRDNGQLLDSYIVYLKAHNLPHRVDLLTGSYLEIRRFIDANQANGTFGQINAALATTILWATCRTIAQLPELGEILRHETGAADQDLLAMQAASIVDFFFKALGRPPSAEGA